MESHLAVPFFDGAVLQLLDPPETPAGQAALAGFLALIPADRLALSAHVHAYYADHVDYTGDGAIPGGLPNAEAIWAHVTPKVLFVETDTDGPTASSYVIIEANCTWEPEHGLMLCFLAGRVLVKCGGYDGHLTNSDAYDDPGLAAVVYAAHSPQFTTCRDP